MQLYGTQATDLLDPSAPPLTITRRAEGVEVEGQRMRPVHSAEEVAALVAEGVGRRKVASQKLNSASSRSHAVLTFYVSAAGAAEAAEAADEGEGDEGDEGDDGEGDGGEGDGARDDGWGRW